MAETGLEGIEVHSEKFSVSGDGERLKGHTACLELSATCTISNGVASCVSPRAGGRVWGKTIGAPSPVLVSSAAEMNGHIRFRKPDLTAIRKTGGLISTQDFIPRFDSTL